MGNVRPVPEGGVAVNDLEAVFTVKCAGGCGRESQTMRVSELWTPQYCPDCRAQGAKQ